jgi:hypothetical protein
MYGYGRVYRSMMGQRHISLQKIVENLILRIKIHKNMHSLLKLSFYKRKIFPPPSSFPKYPKKLKWLVLGYSTLMGILSCM